MCYSKSLQICDSTKSQLTCRRRCSNTQVHGFMHSLHPLRWVSHIAKLRTQLSQFVAVNFN